LHTPPVLVWWGCGPAPLDETWGWTPIDRKEKELKKARIISPSKQVTQIATAKVLRKGKGSLGTRLL